jgi:uncharacterized phage protein gp47/JayE
VRRAITLACEAGEGPHNIDVGDVVIENSDGITVRNIEGLSVSYPATLSSGGTLQLLFEAETAGDAANAAAGSYTTLVTTLAGTTVSEDLIDTLGRDAEKDDRLKARNEAKLAERPQLEPIPLSLQAIALSVAPAVTQLKLDRTNPRGAGTYDLYLAQDGATAGSTEINAVQSAIDARTTGDISGAASTRPGYVQAAPTVALNLTGEVFFDSTQDPAAVQSSVEDDELPSFLETIPLGGFDFSPGPSATVPLTNIEATIRGALGVLTVTLTVPSGDLAVTAFGKVIKGAWSLTYTPVTVA